MKTIKTEDAVGHVLCHDMTQIIPGVYKGARFRKGHVVTAEDIPVLLSMGKEKLYVLELGPGMVHENDAAERLCAVCRGPGMDASEVREGKIELTAAFDGVFLTDSEKLSRVAGIDGLIVATRKGGTAVRKGDKLCGLRVVPLAIAGDKLAEAEQIADGGPVLKLLPWKLKRAGIISTGSELAKGLVEDRFTPVVEKKLAAYGIETVKRAIVGDDPGKLIETIGEFRASGIDLLACTGGMSVDPDDNTPGAIRASGAEVVAYGAPVLPGAMFLLGYYPDGLPVVGLPGCVMYSRASVFDLVLPRLAAGVRLTRADLVAYAEGGLCLGCETCRYPDCPFGK